MFMMEEMHSRHTAAEFDISAVICRGVFVASFSMIYNETVN